MSFAEALVDALEYQPYDEASFDAVSAARADYGGTLGVDLLLGAAGERLAYPPRSAADLKKFIRAVEATELLPRLAQARAIYYLFLDYPADKTGGESVAAHYAGEVRLGEAQEQFVRGVWHLDRGDLPAGVAALGEPWDRGVAEDTIVARVNKWVLEVLCTRAPPLAVSYVEAKQNLRDDADMQLYVDTLVHEGRFERVRELSHEAQNPEIIEHLARAVAAGGRRDHAWLLAALPWTRSEWELVQAQLDAAPAGAAADLARELSLVRAMHVGDLPEIHKAKGAAGYDLLTRGLADM